MVASEAGSAIWSGEGAPRAISDNDSASDGPNESDTREWHRPVVRTSCAVVERRWRWPPATSVHKAWSARRTRASASATRSDQSHRQGRGGRSDRTRTPARAHETGRCREKIFATATPDDSLGHL